MEIFQTKGNVEEVRIKLNRRVSTNGMSSKPVVLEVIFPIDAATQKNEKESPRMRGDNKK
jgi:hypothetical protein